jgi:hypothetical protein
MANWLLAPKNNFLEARYPSDSALPFKGQASSKRPLATAATASSAPIATFLSMALRDIGVG